MKTFIVRFDEKIGQQIREELRGEYEYIEFESDSKRDCIRVYPSLERLSVTSRNNILAVTPESSNKINIVSVPWDSLRYIEELYYGKKSKNVGTKRRLSSNSQKDKKALPDRSRSRKN